MISLRLPEDLEIRINERAKQERRSRSDLIKESILFYLESKKVAHTPYELGEDLFGRASAGPRDLSSNRKAYLKGKLKEKHVRRNTH